MTTDTVFSPFLPAGGGSEAAPDVRQERVTVTPDLAKEWLARNDGNRPLRYPFASQLARDMTAGTWALNGETVKIAADGTLLDGQHRLTACVLAGVPFETLVVTGLPREAQRTIDTGARRRMSDQLTLAGEAHPAILASVARWAAVWQHGGRGKVRGDAEPTHAEMDALLAARPELRESAAWASAARASFRSVRPSVFGMAHWLFTAISEEDAGAFLGRVRDGADIGLGHPVHTLRARMLRARDMQERLTESEQLALFCIAWNAFRELRNLSKLQLPKGGLTPKNFPDPK